jgi:hypothetical protein
LVVEATSGASREARYRTVAPELHLEYSSTDAKRVRETSAIVSSMLRLGIRDFKRSLAAGTAKLAGPERELWALRATGWLEPKQLHSVNAQIQQLRDSVWKPKGPGRLYGITILITPLDQRARKPRTTKQPKRRKV